VVSLGLATSRPMCRPTCGIRVFHLLQKCIIHHRISSIVMTLFHAGTLYLKLDLKIADAFVALIDGKRGLLMENKQDLQYKKEMFISFI